MPNLRVDPQQWAALTEAVHQTPPVLSTADAIATCSVVIAISSILATWRNAVVQRRIERRALVAELHKEWWSKEFEEMRAVVWTELKRWEVERDASPAILNYLHFKQWPLQGLESRAHSRLLFFFADLELMIANGVADEDLALLFFGTAQYGYFQEYFAAILTAIKSHVPPERKTPRFVKDLADLDERLRRWRARRR